ncbi:MFS transporter [Stenotrophomonas sp. NPDC078853]|uniref:MFS transporter n=1 Tax=Stenotrophomonas sp. NPDC078853 TaxID=3364534 RepID=UPI00384B6CE5
MQSTSMLRPGLVRLTVALGIGQIIAWASSYYMLAVLALPISKSTGWSLGLLVGGLSAGLVTAGLLAPLAGRVIDRMGGRAVLTASSVLFALGLSVLALSHSPITYYLGWVVLGVAMASGLYDAAFSTLGQLLGANAKRSIAGLTLVAGFASTLGWPAMSYLGEALGWRGALWVAAAVNILVALPIHLLAVPKHQRSVVPDTIAPAPTSTEAVASAKRATSPTPAQWLVLIGLLLTCQAAIMATLSVHLLALLGAIGLAPSMALLAGMVIGPAQVTARLLEMYFGQGVHPTWSARVGIAATLAAMLLLLTRQPWVAIAAFVIYGAGNGILTVVRGTLPLALIGSADYGKTMGVLARPMLLAQAVAPPLAAIALERVGPTGLICLLAIFAVVSLIGSWWLPTKVHNTCS